MSYIHAIGMKILLKSFKNTFPIVLNVPGYFRPIPATYCINKNPKKHEKSQKMTFFENRYFVVYCLKIWYLAGNWLFGTRKAPWNLILTFLRNMATFDKKSKKSHFSSQKSWWKFFQSRFFRPMSPYHQIDIGDR